MARDMDALRALVLSNFPGIEGWIEEWESALEQSIVQALPHVNRDVPRVLVIQFTGDGTQSYQISDDYFDKEISEVKSVEYPVGENPRSYLKKGDDWFVYQDHNDDMFVVLVNDTPAATETFRIVMTTNHTFTSALSTMGTQSFNALCAKTLELMCKKLEQRLIFTSAPHMDADTVNLGSNQVRGEKFIATYWGEEYRKFAGLNQDVIAAQAQADADILMTTGRDYIWHPRRSR
jgi:hypothetical protein